MFKGLLDWQNQPSRTIILESPGPQGPCGPPGLREVPVRIVDSSGGVNHEDFYIGFVNTGPITFRLPEEAETGRQLYLKLHFGAPQHNRKVTLEGLVDNKQTNILSIPYQTLKIIYCGKQWRAI